ncbi:MAG TPA: winged helix DNA-binding domain-containing protein [Gemmatimonadota bacterium]|nr:winged helix DNA-binding domain-containing protein [Gemmatimonadota bacterium]
MDHEAIIRQRLTNQGLARPAFADPATAVGWLCAVQAQDYAGARWALGTRIASATDDGVRRAFDSGEILRTHVLRPTWHFVLPSDIRWLIDLTGPRVKASMAYRHRGLGLDRATFVRANRALEKALGGGAALTRDDLRSVLGRVGIRDLATERMAHLMMVAELDGVVCSGPRRGRQFTYSLFDERAPASRSLARDEALTELAARFFASRGPATVQDFGKWAGLTAADARAGLEEAKVQLRRETVDGREYWFPPSRAARVPSPTALLLSIYDEYISGYRDRSAIVAPRHARRLMGMGNAVASVIVLDGRIVGTWKRTLTAKTVAVETRAFEPLGKRGRAAVAAAAERYGDFLELRVDLR